MDIFSCQDLSFANGKMAALKNEQRELRCQWLGEKSDLEGRCFQTQALYTQVQGTLRKKEKDYERLQQQLAKVVKDSQRQQKSVITLSKPLPRNSSQVKPTTLRDAELISAQDTIRGLEVMFPALCISSCSTRVWYSCVLPCVLYILYRLRTRTCGKR